MTTRRLHILGAIHRADIEALTWEAWAADVPMSWIRS